MQSPAKAAPRRQDVRPLSHTRRGGGGVRRENPRLEVDAVVSRPNEDWVAFEAKLGRSQVEDGARNLVLVERKVVAAGGRPAAAKCVVIGFGAPAHVTEDGVRVLTVDMLGA